jgi:hypothetical protein
MLDRGHAPGQQLERPFAERRGEAPVGAVGGGAPVGEERRLERVVERSNLLAARARVKRNGGSPGIEGRTVEALPGYRRESWPERRAALLAGTSRPQPGNRVEIPKPGGGVRQLGVPICHAYDTSGQRSLGCSSPPGSTAMLSDLPSTLYAHTRRSACRRMPATMASAGRPRQRGNDLRRQRDAARPHGRRAGARQAPLPAPGADRRDRHGQQLRRLLRRGMPVTTRAPRARVRPFWTPRRDAISPADPADLARRERPTEAGLPPVWVETRGPLRGGLLGRQRTQARHGTRIRRGHVPRPPQAGEVDRR